MEVHIMPIGTRIGHAYMALRKLSPDKAYLIVGKPKKDEKRQEFIKNYEISKKNAEELKNHLLKSEGEVEIREVYAFDDDSLSSILELYREIIEQEKGNKIKINITGGTNLMGAASLSSAYFYGVDAYYVLNPKLSKKENCIINLPIPKIVYTDSLTKKQKFLLKKIGKEGKVEKMSSLVDKKNITSIQALKPHVENLENMGLITVERGNKEYKIQLSDSGEVINDMLK